MRGPEGASVQQCTGATRQLADVGTQIYQQVTGLLGSPWPRRAGGDAQHVHAAGLDLYHEEHGPAPEEHGVNVQEVARQDPGRLGGQELPPGR